MKISVNSCEEKLMYSDDEYFFSLCPDSQQTIELTQNECIIFVVVLNKCKSPLCNKKLDCIKL